MIVDYYGVTRHLAESFAIYTNKDKDKLKNFLKVFRDIYKEIPELETRNKRNLNLFTDKKLHEIE